MSVRLLQRSISSGSAIPNSGLLAPKFEQSKTNPLASEEDYVRHELLRLLPQLTGESIVTHPSFVNLQSSHLCQGLYVLLEYDIFRPTFGKIRYCVY